MNDYIILTDSSCDLPDNLIKEMKIEVLPLSILANNNQYKNYADERDIKFKDVYKILRDKQSVSTSAVNVGDFEDEIEKLVVKGNDVLYLGFSAALSCTYDNGVIAMRNLQAKYPDRKLLHVNTRCASLGQGLIVYLANLEKENGKSIEDVKKLVEDTVPHLCHWFTVDDLYHLKRGGRVSGATAVIGSMLNIKPVMHMDDEGRLINVTKARGRKAAIDALFNKAKETAIDPSNQTMFISHGDCIEDAIYLSQRVKKELGVKDVVINYVGPVIGAHSGPGTLAFFFVGEHR